VHPRWKLFSLGVLVGIVAFVACFGGSNAWLPVIVLIGSLHVAGHASSIMANGERMPVPPLLPFRLWPWLSGMAQGVAIGLLIWFVGPRLSELIGRKAPWIPMAVSPADLARVAVCLCWAFGVVTTFRRLRRRVAAA
jgi:hypothetical protein